MKLNKIIYNIVQECLNEERLIKEYISREELSLKDYLSMSDEQKKRYLPEEYYSFFEDFLYESGIDFEMPKETKPSDYVDEPDEEVDMFDYYDYEFIYWLENNNKELYDKYADWLFELIKENRLGIPDEEYPAWSYFSNDPKIIKNQWLIHLTNDAQSIASEGFKYGIDDMTKLGLTTHIGDFEKKYGGYNFAYILSDFKRYGRRSYIQGGGYKYGKEAVIFRASGIKVYHYGDEEPQVIFYGNTATNIIPIISGEDKNYGIYNEKNNRILYESDKLEDIVDWLEKNYSQYRKVLTKK